MSNLASDVGISCVVLIPLLLFAMISMGIMILVSCILGLSTSTMVQGLHWFTYGG